MRVGSRRRRPFARRIRRLQRVTFYRSIVAKEQDRTSIGSQDMGRAATETNDRRYRAKAVFADRAERRFSFPETDYFAGGPVNVYEIYNSLLY